MRLVRCQLVRIHFKTLLVQSFLTVVRLTKDGEVARFKRGKQFTPQITSTSTDPHTTTALILKQPWLYLKPSFECFLVMAVCCGADSISTHRICSQTYVETLLLSRREETIYLRPHAQFAQGLHHSLIPTIKSSGFYGLELVSVSCV